MLHAAITIVISGLVAMQSTSGQYRGAGAVLTQAREHKPAENAESREEKPKTPVEIFRADVKAFAETVQTLELDEAVDGWIKLLERLNTLPRTSGQYYGGGGMELSGLALLVTALPAPEAWALLRETIVGRPLGKDAALMGDRCVRLLLELLAGDEEAQWQEFVEIEAHVVNLQQWEAQTFVHQIRNLSEALSSISDDPMRPVEAFEQQLTRAESISNWDEIESTRFFGSGIPDLVTLAGHDVADVYLRRALGLPVLLDVRHGAQTQALARSLARELIDDLKTPQWQLAFDVDATDLYEALEGRFIQPNKDDSIDDDDPAAIIERMRRQQNQMEFSAEDQAHSGARYYYLMGLIIRDRFDDAKRVTAVFAEEERPWYYSIYGSGDADDTALFAIVNSGHAAAAADFFHDRLAEDPQLPFWTISTKLDMHLNRTERILALMQDTLATKTLDPRRRDRIRTEYKQTLLAVDRLDEAVELIREEIAKEVNEHEQSNPGQAAIELAKLGTLVERAEWINEGVDGAKKIIREAETTQVNTIVVPLAKLLIEIHRGPEAEQLLADGLAQIMRLGQSEETRWMGTGPSQLLSVLTQTYHDAQRHRDVLTLLDEAPWWGAKDLIGIEETFAYTANYDYRYMSDLASQPLAYIVAAALVDQDHYADARIILRGLINRAPGFDPAYELLTKIDGIAAIEFLDELFSRDPFEERPLIWKAQVLLDAGQLDDAEKVIHEAIAIDPSDGEQGPGHRMRAYTVLADIQAGKGDTAAETQLKIVVEAIRLSEKADKLYNGGLLNRGLAMYRQALDLFADAYCIQSRLAVQLASVGRHEEALEHYRRAYELMPSSFGRMESHCFGCEGVFEGSIAQSIAEQVFAKLVVEKPDDARVNYLLGYLRQQQERYEEALRSYQEAARLDPDYINAWKNIVALRYYTFVPSKLTDTASVNIHRLRPAKRAGFASLYSMRDLQRLWDVVMSMPPPDVEEPESLYVLAASKTMLEKVEAAQREAGQPIGNDFGYGFDMGLMETPIVDSPGKVLARHRIIRELSNIYIYRFKQD